MWKGILMTKWILGALGAALVALVVGIVVTSGTSDQTSAQTITVYKTPSCGVRVFERDDLAPVRASLGVPDELASCHTAKIGGYAIEGHVPAAEIRRLLKERPVATGLAVPGMPMGSPGMETTDSPDAYDVIVFSAETRGVFASYAGRFAADQSEYQ